MVTAPEMGSSNGDVDEATTSSTTVTAVPDVATTASENPSKTFKASPTPEVEPRSEQGSTSAIINGDVPPSVGSASKTNFSGDIDMADNGSINEPGPSSQPSTDPSMQISLSAGSSGSGDAALNEAMQDSETDKGDESPVVSAVPLPEEAIEKDEQWWNLRMMWNGKLFELRVGSNDMVYDFRHQIEQLTSVPAERQKLIGLSKGKLSAELDSTRFGTLNVKKDCKFTMIGTPEELSFKDPQELALPSVQDDFDVDYQTFKKSPKDSKRKSEIVAPADDPRNKRKLESIIKEIPITVMNEPRPNKKLLVLDLDYTMVDTKPLIAGSLPAEACARPGLHDFLDRVYPHYDIVIWSQTSWRWLESKLVEIGVIGGDRSYRVSFVSDRSTMFPVFTMRRGKPFKHEVKPLAYFWATYPHWSAKNTIHIDDLSRNFAMNPGEGLKIKAYNSALMEYANGLEGNQADRELQLLGAYLERIAQLEDFTTLDHNKWKHSLARGER